MLTGWRPSLVSWRGSVASSLDPHPPASFAPPGGAAGYEVAFQEGLRQLYVSEHPFLVRSHGRWGRKRQAGHLITKPNKIPLLW